MQKKGYLIILQDYFTNDLLVNLIFAIVRWNTCNRTMEPIQEADPTTLSRRFRSSRHCSYLFPSPVVPSRKAVLRRTSIRRSVLAPRDRFLRFFCACTIDADSAQTSFSQTYINFRRNVWCNFACLIFIPCDCFILSCQYLLAAFHFIFAILIFAF